MAESQGKIIVIDDEILIIKRLEALLIPRHYEVISASNGEAALTLVLQEQPDLILLDVLMPGMNGFEVCRQLKDDPVTRLIPVVLMTALGEVEDRVKGLEAGADDFLTKPLVALEFRVLVKRERPYLISKLASAVPPSATSTSTVIAFFPRAILATLG